MTDNPNKKTFWDKIHIDPTMLLILLALLVYSSLVIWSASGQDIGMMERKVGQITMGLVIMVVMAQIPPRVYEGWAPEEHGHRAGADFYADAVGGGTA